VAKSRRDWVGDNDSDGRRVSRKALVQAQTETESQDLGLGEEELDVVTADVLEVAHEALSKLFTKSHKRERSMRGVRRKDAWH
jgi:hypothetical protein